MFTITLKKLMLGTALCAGVIGTIFIQQKRLPKEDTITLGTMSGWPPFVSVNAQGSYEGFDIDIANEIARRLGKKLVIQDMDTAALITALEQGTVDFIMTGLDITAERVKKISMIPYQGEPMREMPLIFWKKVPAGIKTLADLKTKSTTKPILCVEPGSSQEEILQQYSDDGFELKYCDPLASILELRYGRALATLSEKKLFLSLKKNYPELVALMVPLDEKNQILGCGIGVKKANGSLFQKISAIIDDLKKNGFLNQQEKRWFAQEGS